MVKTSHDGAAIFTVNSSKEGQIISKKELRYFWTSKADKDRGLIYSVHLVLCSPREKLHIKNENIRQNRISLPNSSSKFEEISFATIDKDKD